MTVPRERTTTFVVLFFCVRGGGLPVGEAGTAHK